MDWILCCVNDCNISELDLTELRVDIIGFSRKSWKVIFIGVFFVVVVAIYVWIVLMMFLLLQFSVG